MSFRSGATQYMLSLGSACNASDIASYSVGSALTATVTIPARGLYVTLSSSTSAGWLSQCYAFPTGATATLPVTPITTNIATTISPALLSPALNGSTITGCATQVGISSVVGVSQSTGVQTVTVTASGSTSPGSADITCSTVDSTGAAGTTDLPLGSAHQ